MSSQTFSSYLMGAESLLVQCAEILLQRGHTVRGVISDNADIAAWARSRSIPVLSPGKGLAERITEDFDWFFSIANLRIIPDAVLAKARQGGVNFHDGPLPRYAGLNAPNWALLNGESQHGVSWHRIEGGVDEGRLLAQRFFDIAPGATALELNTRCYEAAIESFPEVLDRIEGGTAGGEEQDLSQRTYFGKHDRPEALALVDWSADADAAVRLVRALDYGANYPNPLHLAKVVTQDGEVLVVRAAETAQGSGAPGQVLEASPDGATVAAGTGAVRLLALSDQEGQPRCPSTLEGQTLQNPGADVRQRLTERNAEICKADDFWAKRLVQLDPIEVPQVGPHGEAPRFESVAFDAAGLEGSAWVAGVVAFLARNGGKSEFHVGWRSKGLAEAIAGDEAYFAPAVPLHVDASDDVGSLVALLDKELARVEKRVTYARDLTARHPRATRGRFDVILAPTESGPVDDAGVTITSAAIHYDATRLEKAEAETLARRLGVLMAAADEEETEGSELPLLTDAERRTLLHEWNATEVPYESTQGMHQLFEAQVDRTPDARALVFEGKALSYRELDARANKVAHVLRERGVGPDQIVGLYCQRSLELVVGALGILKAGGAYLPLDPEYPEDRIHLMLEDSRAKVVVTHREARGGLRTDADVLVIDDDPHLERASDGRVEVPGWTSANLAYVIYTSGSTGRPKGVMVEHRNASNFFTGMDARIPREEGSREVWLAVTSLSFDISVLELFWTLARGFEVVVHRDRERVKAAGDVDPSVAAKPMAFGLMYWGNDDGQGPKKYECLLEGAKLADRLGYTSCWTPERHFHAFGGPYPNPAVTGAAVAAVTKNLDIRAGSCVAPLHHPIRIAEEWAVLDNISNGRTGLAFASGWQPDDFILRPENAPPNNKKAMFESIEIVKKLWRGEEVEFPKADGSMHAVVTQPRPVSDELAVWVTTAGNPETYRMAGEAGAHVLTHLLGQSLDEVADKIRIYREALEKAGYDPASRKVTLMLHSYIDETRELSRDIAREPMKDYLRSAAGLIKAYAWAFPAFKKPEGVDSPFDIDLGSLDSEEMEAILDFAFQRYFEDSGLFGTVDDAVKRVNQCKAIGVDEIACLVDYGVPTPKVLESIERVGAVIRRTNQPVVTDAPSEDYSLGAQLKREQVTHMQCTPSMARMMTLDDRAREALGGLKAWLIGGEALPGALVGEIGKLTKAQVVNMYGPTETTIWSSTQVAAPGDGITGIGTPIANTQLYVLDANRQPVPVGVPGELYIGGAGVTRGYLYRDELTRERFLKDPFRGGDARMYRTGDLVRWNADGTLGFIGRVDHQVKLRGYRIELGEIESRLNELSAVREAVVIAREDTPGDKRLVAYLTTSGEVEEEALRAHLGGTLPEYMVPSHFVVLDAFPLTPNAKVDRKRLPRPDEVQKKKVAQYVAPESEAEQKIADVWKKVLGVGQVGSKDNFFELGGHSLLAVQAHRELKAAFSGATLSITDIFRFPVLGELAKHLDGAGDSQEKLGKAADRAAKRRELMRRRRGR